MKYLMPFGEIHDPDIYSQELIKRIDHIYGIYFGLTPRILSPRNENEKKVYFLEENLIKVLENLKEYNIEKIFVLNHITIHDYDNFKEIIYLLKEYITCVTVNDLNVGERIYRDFPNLRIDISSNAFVFVPQTLNFWKERIPTLYSCNLPREYSKFPEMLDKFKHFGVKTKIILNEGCILGCPYRITCWRYPKNDKFCTTFGLKLSNIFKTNFIFPSELSKIKDKVDIAKITHRTSPLEKLLKILDSYISEKDEGNFLDIISVCYKNIDDKIFIEMGEIPKKIKECRCLDCLECKICEKFMEKCLKDNLSLNRISIFEYKKMMDRL